MGTKYFLNICFRFEKSITVKNIRMQHEVAALQNFGRRQNGATDAENRRVRR